MCSDKYSTNTPSRPVVKQTTKTTNVIHNGGGKKYDSVTSRKDLDMSKRY